jgi:hypothetical protein
MAVTDRTGDSRNAMEWSSTTSFDVSDPQWSPPPVNVPDGTQVRIRSGRMGEMSGVVVGTSASGRLLIEIEVLSRPVLIELEAGLLDPPR